MYAKPLFFEDGSGCELTILKRVLLPVFSRNIVPVVFTAREAKDDLGLTPEVNISAVNTSLYTVTNLTMMSLMDC